MKPGYPTFRRAYAQDVQDSSGPDAFFLLGISTGGSGGLRMSLKYPDKFGGAISMEPGIDPALEWKDVLPRHKFWRPPGADGDHFRYKVLRRRRRGGANNPATIANKQSGEDPENRAWRFIWRSATRTASAWTRPRSSWTRHLWKNKIEHEYHLVHGADHVGRTIRPRASEGLQFLARNSWNPPPPRVRQRIAASGWGRRRRRQKWIRRNRFGCFCRLTITGNAKVPAPPNQQHTLRPIAPLACQLHMLARFWWGRRFRLPSTACPKTPNQPFHNTGLLSVSPAASHIPAIRARCCWWTRPATSPASAAGRCAPPLFPASAAQRDLAVRSSASTSRPAASFSSANFATADAPPASRTISGYTVETR